MGQEEIIDLLDDDPASAELECKYEYLHDLYISHSGMFIARFRIEAVKNMLQGPNAPAIVVQQFKNTGRLPYTVADRVEHWLNGLDQLKVRTVEEDKRILYLKGLIFMAAYELINFEENED